MDQPGITSRESDKITQIEARTRAYGSRKRIYMECTVSTEQGRTWQEYINGTKSRIALPCPHCHAWVGPEREHLVGWQGTESQAAARSAAQFSCPDCGQVWNEAERTEANRRARLLHGQQSISDDNILGAAPATDTLGFRWSAVNNLFLTGGDLGADEWRSSKAADEENAEREMRQFVWCLPVAPSRWAETSLEPHELTARMIDLPRGVVPKTTKWLSAAIDLGKHLCHWVVVAWSDKATGHVVDYGRIEVASEDLGVEQAMVVALREFRDSIKEGFPVGTEDGSPRAVDQTWIDAGYMTHVVYSFCREAGEKFLPALGRGAAQHRSQWYSRPTQTGNVVRHIGEGFHISWHRAEKIKFAEVDADHWKTWVHQRLSTPMGKDGAMTLFQAPPQEHLALAKHLTAEIKTEEFVSGKGVVVKWQRIRKQNHFFDALYNACTAGYYCGVRLVDEHKPVRQLPWDRPTIQEIIARNRKSDSTNRG
ncbi:MAG: terminase gpA endonuclease subunit, partial [Planctomycetota bacterium]|nr:terminase gpA endonuclease subunit [Planctomycetota bacterium]